MFSSPIFSFLSRMPRILFLSLSTTFSSDTGAAPFLLDDLSGKEGGHESTGLVRSFHRSGRYRGESGIHVLTVYNVNVDVNEIMEKEGSGGGFGVGSGPDRHDGVGSAAARTARHAATAPGRPEQCSSKRKTFAYVFPLNFGHRLYPTAGSFDLKEMMYSISL